MQMIPLKDIRNNTVVNVSLDDMPNMVASGHFALPKDTTLPIMNPEGQLGDIHSSEYMKALQNGWAPASSQDIQKQIDVANFGDSPLRTGLERAASAASFGTSDFIASQLNPKLAEDMRKREELNPEAAVVGEVAGVVGPALLSGGTSLAARAVSAPIRGIESLGARAAAKVAANLPKTGLAAKIAAEMVPRAAGLGVEGALYGAGNYLSDASLGNADWSAESMISHVGMSGLMGAGLGSALGAAKLAAAPVIQKIKGWHDVNKLADEMAGLQTVKGQKLSKDLNDGELASYLVNDVNGGKLTPFSKENMAESAAKVLEDNGTKLDSLLTNIDSEAVQAGALPSKAIVLERIEDQLNKLASESKINGKVVPGQESIVDAVEKARSGWKSFFESAEKAGTASTEPISVAELNEIRKTIGAAGKFDSSTEAIATQINRELYPAFRKTIDEVAGKVSQGEALKELNRKLYTGIKLQPFLERESLKAEKSGIMNFRDIVAGAAAGHGIVGNLIALGRGAQKLAENSYVKSAQLIYAVKSAERGADKAINDGLRDFFLNTGRAVKGSTLKLSTDAKEYNDYTQKIEQFANNPDSYLENMSKKHVGMSKALPTVTAAAEATGLRGMQFLASKMPRQVTVPGIIPKKYTPTTQERAKFMRYAEVVQDPKTALRNFQKGTLSKENVEALKVVYPEFYKRMSDKTMQFISLHGEKLPYNKKVQLGTMLNLPVDSSLQPENIRRLQSGFAAQGGDQSINMGVTGLGKLNKSGRMSGQSEN